MSWKYTDKPVPTRTRKFKTVKIGILSTWLPKIIVKKSMGNFVVSPECTLECFYFFYFDDSWLHHHLSVEWIIPRLIKRNVILEQRTSKPYTIDWPKEISNKRIQTRDRILLTQREKCLVAKITCRVKIFKNPEREIFENTLFKKLKLGPLLSRLLIGQFKPRNFVYFFFFFFVKDQKTGFITGWSGRKK